MPNKQTGGWFVRSPAPTEPTPPAPEFVRGRETNIPYRGMTDHGVPADGEYWAPAEVWAEEPIPDYMEPEAEPRPIPVKIVQETGREIKDWSAAQFTVSDAPQLIAGRNARRTSVRIKNLDADTNVYLGHTIGVSSFSGWRLIPGEDENITTSEEVYAVSADNTQVTLNVLLQFTVES